MKRDRESQEMNDSDEDDDDEEEEGDLLEEDEVRLKSLFRPRVCGLQHLKSP